MKGTPEEVLKAIPDFDEFKRLSEEITKLMYDKLILDTSIKDLESRVFETASNNEKYFQGGKSPSTAYIERTWGYRGLNGEIMPLRIKLAELVSQLDGKRSQMDIYKTMVEIWRTLCSNNRTAGF